MKNQKSPFEITNQMIDYVAEIAELVETIGTKERIFCLMVRDPWMFLIRLLRRSVGLAEREDTAGDCCAEW